MMNAEAIGYATYITGMVILFAAIATRYVLKLGEPTFENEPEHAKVKDEPEKSECIE